MSLLQYSEQSIHILYTYMFDPNICITVKWFHNISDTLYIWSPHNISDTLWSPLPAVDVALMVVIDFIIYLTRYMYGLLIIYLTRYMCNGYGIWINKDKLRYDLMSFNRLPEPWRASPESWHLSRYYYIYSTITFTQVENISCELALKPVLLHIQCHHIHTSGEHLLRVGT